MENLSISFVEKFKKTLADSINVDPDEIEVSYETKDDGWYVSSHGLLCTANEREIIDGLKLLDYIDLNTQEGREILEDYEKLNLVDELITYC